MDNRIDPRNFRMLAIHNDLHGPISKKEQSLCKLFQRCYSSRDCVTNSYATYCQTTLRYQRQSF